ncbi:DapH/DapD/GlmU-related protein [Coraliomargarita sp. SDUM461003]|uniref:Serine acetyltransferase n=1 Tax=Thalassobacterium maritimum TaxID=3041265 RepID=A0ABU1AWJ4_9BACT|nr:DapH/DapD/GlmU-related protein [Coraliomargarita sp. SDUM461003]MDQ8208530.1 DapH/DapD/GlmU-related protein [Coraliomargarita sp. SDUM461003]
MSIKEDLKAKARWLYQSDTAAALLKVCLTDGTLALLCYRGMQWSQRAKLTPLTMIFNKLNVWFGQCIIGRGAEFGERLVLIHSQGIVINGEVRGGDDIMIEHQVTIGAEGRQAPQLGSRVFIGAGAKIIGAVKVGDDVKIGANAVVTKDLPNGATAVGVPAKVIKIYGDPVAK